MPLCARSQKPQYTTVCPKCKSPDVSIDNSNPLQGAMGLPGLYICNSCGHRGYTFPEMDIAKLSKTSPLESRDAKTERQAETADPQPLVDISYGNFIVRFLWKITGPVSLVVGILIITQQPIAGAVFLGTGIITIYLAWFRNRSLRNEPESKSIGSKPSPSSKKNKR